MSAFGGRSDQRGRGRLVIALVVAGSLCALVPSVAEARPDLLDLREAVVVTPAQLSGPDAAALDLLLDEVEKRSIIRWPVVHEWPTGATPVVAIGHAAEAEGGET